MKNHLFGFMENGLMQNNKSQVQSERCILQRRHGGLRQYGII